MTLDNFDEVKKTTAITTIMNLRNVLEQCIYVTVKPGIQLKSWTFSEMPDTRQCQAFS